MIEKYIKEQKLSIKVKQALETISIIIKEVSLFENPSQAINYIINATNYQQYIEKNAENDLEIQSRKENLQELITASKSFTQEYKGNIHDFVDYLSILYEKTERKEQEDLMSHPPILLMSIHASKGLEFSTVFIVGLEEGIFPSSRSNLSKESLEEERRLFYVAITRAEDKLICSYALSRAQWGTIKTQYQSIFIDDLNSDLITKLSFKKYMPIQIEKIAAGENFSYGVFNQNTEVIVNKQVQLSNQNISINNSINHPLFGIGKIIKEEKIILLLILGKIILKQYILIL